MLKGIQPAYPTAISAKAHSHSAIMATPAQFSSQNGAASTNQYEAAPTTHATTLGCVPSSPASSVPERVLPIRRTLQWNDSLHVRTVPNRQEMTAAGIDKQTLWWARHELKTFKSEYRAAVSAQTSPHLRGQLASPTVTITRPPDLTFGTNVLGDLAGVPSSHHAASTSRLVPFRAPAFAFEFVVPGVVGRRAAVR